ncbi:kelch domain-containing protein 10-like [Physella acuta]|uniref:kelch domain-containing protein 10-like n=1 Tax=Physella acuta TaxID=109671 RepID=UPI0027DD01D6|nr:kelch domain-containing protein 10-like [Physella acuta]
MTIITFKFSKCRSISISRSILLICLWQLSFSHCQQKQDWTWLGGDEGAGQLSTVNYPGGRSASGVWPHNDSVFIFGGKGFSDLSTGSPHLLNDVWQFQTATNSFHLHHPGTFPGTALENVPESRQHPCVCGHDDAIIVFGGLGAGGFGLSDLWAYNINTKNWSQESDKSKNSSLPSGRGQSAVWCYNSSMYVFGGMSHNSVFHDMWRLNLTSLTWTRLWDEDSLNVTYSSLKSPMNVTIRRPMGRNGAAAWVSDDTFYLFGGNTDPTFAYNLQQTSGLASDLWKYHPSHNSWHFVAGPTETGQGSRLNGIGTFSPSNVPGCRRGAASWADAEGNLWLFGGAGKDSQPDSPRQTSKLLSDLWRFHVRLHQWAFMGGSQIGDLAGSYKAKHEDKHTSFPGSRTEMLVWRSHTHVAEIFGGLGHDGRKLDGYLNDLWSVDFTAAFTREYMISPLTAVLFFGVGTGTLLLLMVFILWSRKPCRKSLDYSYMRVHVDDI